MLGRPPHTRGVCPFDELHLPSEVVLDTSFVVAALRRGENGYAACAYFLTRPAENDTTVYFNQLLEIELQHAVVTGTLRARWRKHWTKKRHDGRALRTVQRELDETNKGWRDFLDAKASSVAAGIAADALARF